MQQPYRRGMKADVALSYVKIEKRARTIRHNLGLSASDPLPGISLFEGLSMFSSRVGRVSIPLGDAVRDLPPGTLAETRCKRSPDHEFEIALSEATYEGLENHEPRARFSLAHELGHAFLHASELVRLLHLPTVEVAALFRSENLDHATCYDTEWQADAFAGALLIPAEGLAVLSRARGFLTPGDLQDRYFTSYSASCKRIEVYEGRRWPVDLI